MTAGSTWVRKAGSERKLGWSVVFQKVTVSKGEKKNGAGGLAIQPNGSPIPHLGQNNELKRKSAVVSPLVAIHCSLKCDDLWTLRARRSLW